MFTFAVLLPFVLLWSCPVYYHNLYNWLCSCEAWERTCWSYTGGSFRGDPVKVEIGERTRLYKHYCRNSPIFRLLEIIKTVLHRLLIDCCITVGLNSFTPFPFAFLSRASHRTKVWCCWCKLVIWTWKQVNNRWDFEILLSGGGILGKKFAGAFWL